MACSPGRCGGHGQLSPSDDNQSLQDGASVHETWGVGLIGLGVPGYEKVPRPFSQPGCMRPAPVGAARSPGMSLHSVTFRPLPVYTRRCTVTTQLAERQNLAALPRGRGRGPGGQPAGLVLPTGRCPVPGCEEQIDPARLMCRRDWYRVPKRQRDRVWRTWRSGREASSLHHQEVVLEAITAARIARLPWLRRHLSRPRLLVPH